VPGLGTRQRKNLKKIDGVGSLGHQVAFFCRVLHSAKRAFAECRPLPSASALWHSAKPLFAEWKPSTQQRVWHSAKPVALSKSGFSRSESLVLYKHVVTKPWSTPRFGRRPGKHAKAMLDSDPVQSLQHPTMQFLAFRPSFFISFFFIF
jgi:hypothetical protein